MAARWEETAEVVVYILPSCGFARFERHLNRLRECVSRYLPGPVLVLGDLNAKHATWHSSRTDPRGKALLDWAAAHNLRLLNTGDALTCVRRFAGSIVDLTFASPAAVCIVRDWHVVRGGETLSDHRYISMIVGHHAGDVRASHTP